MSTSFQIPPPPLPIPSPPVNIKIVPTDKLKTGPYNMYCSFIVTNISVNQFNGDSNVNVVLFDKNEQFIQNTNVSLTKEEYDNWGTDDKYIVDLVATKLGFTIVDRRTS